MLVKGNINEIKMEHGTWSIEYGIWSIEHGAWNKDLIISSAKGGPF
jgi:hypothetical protein